MALTDFPVLTNNWKLYLANSKSMVLLAELNHARQKSLTVTLNRPGSLSFVINQDDDPAPIIEPITTCVIAYKNGNPVWSGPVWTIEDKLPDKTTSVNCVGWFELLMHRILLAQLPFASTDAGVIAQQLINTVNTTFPTGITVGTVETTQPRTRSYNAYQNIGEEINTLSTLESGFDWTIDPLTKVLSIWEKKMTDQTNVVFNYPGNLSEVDVSIDSSTVANSIYALGQGSVSSPANDVSSQSSYGYFEETSSLSEVTDLTILNAFANADVVIKAQPKIIYNIVPKPNLQQSTYSLFQGYDIGDKVYFTCNTGRIKIIPTSQAIRIFGATINIDEDGIEKISQLQTSPS